MKNLIALVVAGIAVAVSVIIHALVLGLIAGAVFVIFWFRQMKQNVREAVVDNAKINQTNDALKQGVIDAHLLVVSKLFGYPVKAREVVEILVEAAGYLGNPPATRMVVGAQYVIDWNNKGLALVAKADKIIADHLVERPYSGGLFDTSR